MTYGRKAHLYIVDCSTVQYSPEVEEESSRPYVECEVPRELLLHRSELIPPPVLRYERFEANEYTSIKRRRMIVQCKEEDVEKNGYPQTEMQHNDPDQSKDWAG